MDMLEFNKEKLEKLRQSYLKALEDGKSSFKFEEKDIFTAYARYMIEYLDSKFHHTK